MSELNKKEDLVISLFALLVTLLLFHTVFWAVAKCIIYVAQGLFSYDLTGKFWPVYVGVFVIKALLNNYSPSKKGCK